MRFGSHQEKRREIVMQLGLLEPVATPSQEQPAAGAGVDGSGAALYERPVPALTGFTVLLNELDSGTDEMSLEELVLRHAVGLPLPATGAERGASGVMMLRGSRVLVAIGMIFLVPNVKSDEAAIKVARGKDSLSFIKIVKVKKQKESLKFLLVQCFQF